MTHLVPERIWTVRIGEYGIEQYREALLASGTDISYWAEKDVLRHIEPASGRYDLDLAVQASSVFGIAEDCNFSEHVTLAEAAGYRPCPSEAALALRLHYADQPEGEWLQIAMQPAGSGGGYDNVLCLVNYHGRLCLWWSWLHFNLTGYLPTKPGPARQRIWLYGEPRLVVEI